MQANKAQIVLTAMAFGASIASFVVVGLTAEAVACGLATFVVSLISLFTQVRVHLIDSKKSNGYRTL